MPNSKYRGTSPNRSQINHGLMDINALAAYLGVAVQTVRKMRHESRAPQAVMIGRLPRWRQEDVDAWLDTQAQR